MHYLRMLRCNPHSCPPCHQCNHHSCHVHIILILLVTNLVCMLPLYVSFCQHQPMWFCPICCLDRRHCVINRVPISTQLRLSVSDEQQADGMQKSTICFIFGRKAIDTKHIQQISHMSAPSAATYFWRNLKEFQQVFILWFLIVVAKKYSPPPSLPMDNFELINSFVLIFLRLRVGSSIYL